MAAPAKVQPPPFLKEVLTKSVARIGKKQLWRISAHLRGQETCDVDDLRIHLRRLGVFIEDASYEHMQVRYFGMDSSTEAASPHVGQPNDVGGVYPLLTVTSAFILDLLSVLSPRRRHVLNLLLAHLGVVKPELIGPQNPDGLLVDILLQTLYEKYDVLRHPDVANDIQPVEKVRQKYVDALDFEGHATHIAVEELMLYYVGISASETNDTAFELLCMRSFSLDRPRLNFEEELDRMQGCSAVAHYNRMVGQPHCHPLYTTTYEDYGKEIEGGKPPPVSRYGRSQKFSRSIPPHTGGATSMNM